ncbi:MAG TPA: MSEP-CTERM sorting domain-containing protein, partial [Chthoniobacteraceae bacterium]|nr:MSEP-CTERM sorting domain-containing protein [Chthoniobacteraceae bacterium]
MSLAPPMEVPTSAWTKPPRRPLLPEWLSRRSLLLWIGTLPQVILLLINLRMYRLITGELTDAQRTVVFRLFALELALLLGITALALFPLRRPKSLGWLSAGPIFLTAAAYLWAAMVNLDHLIPASVGAWMLPPEMQIYYQFILVMPVVFYTGVWMACRPMKLSPWQEFGLITLIVVGLPSVFWAAVWTLNSLNVYPRWSGWFAVACFIAGSVLVLAAVARGCVALFGAIRRGPPLGEGILMFLVGIAGPLGGLWLNHTIPFPSDFQAWPVYAMAALNGCVLLLPRRLGRTRAVWLARCALFPFTLYFFLVFLPFLPLSLLAMVALGAGFLILVPTALFLMHGWQVLEGYQFESVRLGRRGAAVAAAAAMALLPAFFIGEAVWDRTVLRGALDYVYSPDLRQQTHFHGNRAAVRRSLVHLRDFKAGVQMPFLSDFYTWAVFDNLVLPDDKMEALHRAFFGSDLPEVTEGGISMFGGRPSRRGVARELTRGSDAPPVNVLLDKFTANTVRDGTCERTTFQLELQGIAPGQNEYTAEIHIPDGVFVSGFWLKIGEERVPGRLFEKKAALWVYRQISRVQRRDPGILVYRDAHTIDLRVFPITDLERRYLELEVLYPAGLHPALKIGDRTWQGEGSGPATAFTLTNEGTSALALSPEAIAQLPRAARTPYLHFIIDRSVNAALPDDQIAAAIRAAALKFPQVRDGTATWGNYEFTDVTPVPVTLAQLDYFVAKPPARRGGFLPERAIEHALLAYHDRLALAGPDHEWLKRYPVFIILGSKAGTCRPVKELAAFAAFAPDSDLIYATPEATTWEAYDFAGVRWLGPAPIKPAGE